MNINIGEAKPEDAAEIQQVFYETWLATYPNLDSGVTAEDVEDRFKDRLSHEGIAKRADQIANLGPGSLFLAAKDGEKIIGICILRKDETKNQLSAIYILPKYQGRGIGRMFWQEAQKFFNPGKKINVEVDVCNKRAIAFYEKLGFADTGRRFADENFRMKSGAVIPEMEMEIDIFNKKSDA